MWVFLRNLVKNSNNCCIIICNCPCSLVSCVLGVYLGRRLGSCLCTTTVHACPWLGFSSVGSWAFPWVRGRNSSGARPSSSQHLVFVSGKWHLAQCALSAHFSSTVCLAQSSYESQCANSCRHRASQAAGNWWNGDLLPHLGLSPNQSQPQSDHSGPSRRCLTWLFPWTRISSLHIFVSFKVTKL